MSGKHSQLTEIQARKQLLLAESAVNRAQLRHDCAALVGCFSSMKRELHSVTSTVSSLISGVKLVNGIVSSSKASMTSTLFKFARTGLAFWGNALSRHRS